MLIQQFDERIKRMASSFDPNNNLVYENKIKPQKVLQEIENQKEFVKESFVKEKSYFEEVIERTPQIWTFVMNTLLKEYQQQDSDVFKDKKKFDKNLQNDITDLVKNSKELYETISDINFIEKKNSENHVRKLNEEISSLRNHISDNNKDTAKQNKEDFALSVSQNNENFGDTQNFNFTMQPKELVKSESFLSNTIDQSNRGLCQTGMNNNNTLINQNDHLLSIKEENLNLKTNTTHSEIINQSDLELTLKDIRNYDDEINCLSQENTYIKEEQNSLKKVISEYDIKIFELNKTINQKDKTINQKDSQIQNTHSVIEDKNNCLSQENTYIKEEQNSLKKLITEYDIKIFELNKTINQKDSQIQNKDSVIEDKNQILTNKDHNEIELMKMLDDLSKQIKELQICKRDSEIQNMNLNTNVIFYKNGKIYV